MLQWLQRGKEKTEGAEPSSSWAAFCNCEDSGYMHLATKEHNNPKLLTWDPQASQKVPSTKSSPPSPSPLKRYFSNPLPIANPFLIRVYASLPTGGNIRKHPRGKSLFLRKGSWLLESFGAQLCKFGSWWTFICNKLSLGPFSVACFILDRYCCCN